jgi:hypothetical protein
MIINLEQIVEIKVDNKVYFADFFRTDDGKLAVSIYDQHPENDPCADNCVKNFEDFFVEF